MLVPVLERDGLLGDVRFLQVVLLSTGWFVVDSAVWEGRGLGLGRWCGGGHVERDFVVRTVDVQDKPPSVGVGIPRTLKGCVGLRGCGLGQERKLTQTAKRSEGKRRYWRAQGFIIIQDSSSNVLLGIQDAAGANGTAGEWSFPSRTTALVQFPGNLVLVLLVGPREADAA